MQIEEIKLSSGLSLIKVPMESESVTILGMVRAGSRDEFGGKWGVAHFLEHFVFKGTKKYPKVNDVTKVIDEIGGIQNAFTWNDFTGFWTKVAAESIEKGLEVVSQLMTESLLPNEELEKEKGAIIQEIKMYEDEPRRKVWDVFDEVMFEGSVLARPVIGFEETVLDVKREDLKAFLDRWYRADNMVLIVSGNLNQVQNLEEMIEQKFVSINKEKTEINRDGYDNIFTQIAPKIRVLKRKTEQAHLILGVRGYRSIDEKNYPLAVASRIFGESMSSRLWNEVREKRGLAYYVKSFAESHTDVGMFGAVAGVKLSEVFEAVRVIREEMLKLADKGVSEEELKTGKDGVKGILKLRLEENQEIAMSMGEDWVMNGGKISSLDEMLMKVDGVKKDDLDKAVKEIVSEEKLNLAVVGNFDEDKFVKVMK